MRNKELADIFTQIGDILEIVGENPFKVRAYRRVALLLENMPEEIERVYAEGRLEELPGIGEGIAKKIRELLETGKLKYFEELKAQIPEGLTELLKIPEVGPKTVQLLWKELGVTNIEELKKALDSGRIRELPGMGAKKEENIRHGLELMMQGEGRMLLGQAYPLARAIVEQLKEKAPVIQISPAGSLRRMKETVGDIDILVTSKKAGEVMEVFVNLPEVREVIACGDTKSSVRISGNLQVDVRVVDEECFGAALMYFTGSKQHNIHLRGIANERGLKISEYGVFRMDNNERIAGLTEEEVYATLDLPYIEPELREDRGEIEAAYEGRLPRLVRMGDIKGDFHVHSKYSDGSSSMEEIAQAALERGYEFVAICDHSQSLKVAGGVSREDKLRQIEEIKRLNEKFEGKIRILAGAEVDILQDGSLDYDDELLAQLDVVVAAIHTAFKLDEKTQTERIVRAMRHPYVHIIAHPTGRLLNMREEYPLDIGRVLEVARETGTALEINAFPDRLDLNDVNCRAAKMEGVVLALGTDAHHIIQLDTMIYGVATARRGWIEPEDLLNTRSVDKILQWFREKRARVGS